MVRRINSIKDLDPDMQRKVKSDLLRRLLIHMERNPSISEQKLLSVFGINRSMIYTQCPWLRPEARARAVARASFAQAAH